MANSLEELYALIQKKIDESLKEDVSEVVKQVESIEAKNILDEYDPIKYDPIKYERRDHNGIDDVNNMTDNVSNGMLTIANETEFNQSQDNNPNYHTSNQGNDLIGLIEYGDGWNGYKYDYAFGENKDEFTTNQDTKKYKDIN